MKPPSCMAGYAMVEALRLTRMSKKWRSTPVIIATAGTKCHVLEGSRVYKM